MLLSSESENFVATRNWLISVRYFLCISTQRETFDQDFVAPSVDPCAIVACDCLQWSLHPHHVLSPLVPGGGFNQEKDEIDDVTDS